MVPIEDSTGMNLAIEDEDLSGDKSYLVKNTLSSDESWVILILSPTNKGRVAEGSEKTIQLFLEKYFFSEHVESF